MFNSVDEVIFAYERSIRSMEGFKQEVIKEIEKDILSLKTDFSGQQLKDEETIRVNDIRISDLENIIENIEHLYLRYTNYRM